MILLPFVLASIANPKARIIQCLDQVVDVYFKENNLLVVSAFGAPFPVQELAATGSKPIISLSDGRVELTRILRENRYDVVIYVSGEAKAIEETFRGSARYLKGKIIAVTEGKSQDTAKQVISILWKVVRTENVVVLTEDDEGVKALSWFPYRPAECTDVRTVAVMDKWRNGFFRAGKDLFPKKLSKNLNGCEVLALTRPIEPYVFTPKHPYDYEEGYEVRIVNDLIETFNVSLRYVPLLYPEVFWTKKGFFGMLVAQEIDLAFGGIMTRHDRSDQAEGLYPHMVDELIWTYPKPGVKRNFSTIYTAFSPFLWILIVLYHLLVTSAFFLACKISHTLDGDRELNFSSCFFICLAVLFNTTTSQPKALALRSIIIIYIVYALHLAAAYQSSIIVLLTHFENRKSPDNVSQLVDDGMIAYLFFSGNSLYNKSDHDTWKKILTPDRHRYIDGIDMSIILNDIAINRSSFLLFPRSSVRYLTTKYYSDQGVSHFSFLSYLTYSLTIYVSPGNPLQGLFDDHLHKLIDTGIIQHWIKLINRSQKSGAEARYGNAGNETKGDRKSLNLTHLQGVFLTWSVFLLFGVLVFAAEILVRKIHENRSQVSYAASSSPIEFFRLEN